MDKLEPNIKNQPLKVAIETLGCKLNLAESEQITRQLSAAGYYIVNSDDKADIYILNTCTVTHIADRKSRHLLRMARRRNPESIIIALGCYSDYAAQTLRKMDEIDLVVSNESKNDLVSIIRAVGAIGISSGLSGKLFTVDRTRSFVKAQDGCNNFCTYCIIPFVRGREKSLPLNNVIEDIKRRVDDGYQEVVLTGTEIGRYGYDKYGIKDLIEAILKESTIPRLRLSSLQPQEITSDLLELWADRRLCRHFHISLQSGSDTVLNRMNRRYTTADFKRTLQLVRENIDDVSITSDIIVGFPGETEDEFEQSYKFSEEAAFSRIHIFSYSARDGTKAAVMADQIEARIKKQRSMKMLSLAQSSLRAFNQSFLHRTMDVLFEQCEEGLWSGLTDNYIKVYVSAPLNLSNKILPVELSKLTHEGIEGELKG